MKCTTTGLYLTLALAAVTAAVSQHAIAEELSMKSPQFTAARVAERYAARYYPDFDTIRSPPIVSDLGTAWEVLYELPPNFSGGTPVILIDKTSLHVIEAHREQ